MTKLENPPRVFVSHASEDKPFVLPLAERLRGDGVQAWVDKWELLAGDSLADRIFEEGIRNCEVFLIVLSRTSVAKPWVREELNAGFAMKLEKSTRLIALRIDECDVPVALKSRLWINMDPVSSMNEESYRQLLNAIYQRRDKPILGASPFETIIEPAAGDTHDETVVLDLFVREALTNDPRNGLTADAVATKTALPPAVIHEAMEMLESDGYLKVERTLDRIFFAQLTTSGWQHRAGAAAAIDPDADVHTIVAAVASDGPMNGAGLLTRSGLPSNRMLLAVQLAEAFGYVVASRVISAQNLGLFQVRVTPAGKKLVR